MRKIEELLNELHPEKDFTSCEDFITEGLLDSLDMVRLITLLENEYRVHVEGTDLVPMNFQSIPAIRKLLIRYGVKGEI